MFGAAACVRMGAAIPAANEAKSTVLGEACCVLPLLIYPGGRTLREADVGGRLLLAELRRLPVSARERPG